jgi:ribose 5-phosphate isomerase B
MSLRATSPAIAKEILAAWFTEQVKPEELDCIQLVTAIEQKYSGQT